MNAVLEELKNKLIESWNKSDEELHEAYVKFCEEHKDEKFDYARETMSASRYFVVRHATNQHEEYAIYYGLTKFVREENEKQAEKFVKRLQERIEGVVGEIKEITPYSTENGNGWNVTGDKAKAIVLSIMAGGYNIQRLHIRNIIKKVK